MAMQTYLVNCHPAADLTAMKSIATHIRQLGGLILMATKQRAIIAAFDDSQLDAVRRYPAVIFVGGVTLDPRGHAARELHRVFTQHMAAQLMAAERK